jgi:hypothetical protein
VRVFPSEWNEFTIVRTAGIPKTISTATMATTTIISIKVKANFILFLSIFFAICFLYRHSFRIFRPALTILTPEKSFAYFSVVSQSRSHRNSHTEACYATGQQI